MTEPKNNIDFSHMVNEKNEEIKDLERNVNIQSKILMERDKTIEELEERLDGEVGYFFESMDFTSMAEYASRADKELEEYKRMTKTLTKLIKILT